MSPNNHTNDWQLYSTEELSRIDSIITPRGYALEDKQPHIIGERFLMQAVSTESGRKLILLGRRLHDNKAVVIKGSSDPAGQQELRHEQTCRQKLSAIPFAYEAFHAPQLIELIETDELVVTIQEFIEQRSAFLDRPVAEQFQLSLHAFKAQESAHATTQRHFKEVAEVFGIKSTSDYLATMKLFVATAHKSEIVGLGDKLSAVQEKLVDQQRTIEQYQGFLTHTDFVPHNFRIQNDVMYLLDFSSLRFANKHEGWARFLNFMALYNPTLEAAYLTYMKDNRSPEEQQSLHLMRLYRLSELIYYYLTTLPRSTGDLYSLNRARVDFWHNVLKAESNHERINENIRLKYQATRDSLRSPEEKARQKGLH